MLPLSDTMDGHLPRHTPILAYGQAGEHQLFWLDLESGSVTEHRNFGSGTDLFGVATRRDGDRTFIMTPEAFEVYDNGERRVFSPDFVHRVAPNFQGGLSAISGDVLWSVDQHGDLRHHSLRP